MNPDLLWVLGLLAGAITLFVIGKPRMDVVALLVLVALPLTGVLDLQQTLALQASLRAEPIAGIEDIVPAARTLLVRFRPGAIAQRELISAIGRRRLDAKVEESGTLIEIPVRYDGEDLAEVALAAGEDPGDLRPAAGRRLDRVGAVGQQLGEGGADGAAAEQPDPHGFGGLRHRRAPQTSRAVRSS